MSGEIMKVGTLIRAAGLKIASVLGLLLICGSAQAQLLGSSGNIATFPGPAPGEQFTELSSGVFTYSKTDLSLPGPMPSISHACIARPIKAVQSGSLLAVILVSEPA